LIENEYEEEHGTEGNECGNGNLKESVGTSSHITEADIPRHF
jgi:hypothetical protein